MEYNRSFRVGNGTNPIQVNGKYGKMTTTGLTIVRLVTAMLLGDKLLTDRGNGGGDLIPSYECYYPLVVEHDLGVTYGSDS